MNNNVMKLLTVACLALGSFTAMVAMDKDESTVALWNLNEGEGTILNDESDSKIKLKLFTPADKKDTPAPKWVSTPDGKGVLFRAEDGRQFHGKAVPLKDQLTFEAWIKPVKNGSRMALFQCMEYKKKGFRVGLSNDLQFHLSLNGKKNETPVRSKSRLPSGKWSHIALTYDGKIVKIYLNGKLDSEKEMPGYDLSGIKYSLFGYTGGTPYFNGIVDSIKISNAAKSDFSKSLAAFKKK